MPDTCSPSADRGRGTGRWGGSGSGIAGHIGHVQASNMDKNGWNVGEAKQQFSEVLRRSETEPQLIYHRRRLVAAVVAVDEANVATISRRVTIADRIREARALFRRENYKL